MDLGLEGKVAWVNGGSSGLGLASAASLARAGARVAISARDPDRLQAAAAAIEKESGSRVAALSVDVRDPEAITRGAEQIRAELGPVQILVSNAGGPPPGGFDDVDDDALLAAFILTTASAWRLTKAVLPGMRETGSGVLLYVTSGSTKEVIPGLLLSNMMRPAVVGLAKSLSKEVAKDGIRVACVAPGRIDTPRVAQLDEAAAARTGEEVSEVKRRSVASIPMERYGDPQEFGDVVAFLASERASFVNGVSLSVDGGALNGLLS